MPDMQNLPTPLSTEAYLVELDRALTPLSPAERDALLTLTRARIEREAAGPPQRELGEVLRSLEPAGELGARLLRERGITPRRGGSSRLKWLLIALLSLLAAGALALALTVRKYLPLYRFDEKGGRVVLLGGLVDLNAKTATLKFGDKVMSAEETLKHYEGRRPVKDPRAVSLRLVFLSGLADLSNSADATLTWKCALAPAAPPPAVTETNGLMTLDLHESAGSRCELRIPAGMRAVVEGNVGHVTVLEPAFPVQASLTSGNILFTPAPSRKYRIEASVSAGAKSDFVSSTDADAIPVKLSVVNGTIRNEPR